MRATAVAEAARPAPGCQRHQGPSHSRVPWHRGDLCVPRAIGQLPRDGRAEPRAPKPWQTGSAGHPRCLPFPRAVGPPGQHRAVSGSALLHPTGTLRQGPATPPPPWHPSLDPPSPGATGSQPQPTDGHGSAGNNLGTTSCAEGRAGAHHAAVVPRTGWDSVTRFCCPQAGGTHTPQDLRRDRRGAHPGRLGPLPGAAGSPAAGAGQLATHRSQQLRCDPAHSGKGNPLPARVGAASPVSHCGGSRIRSQHCRAGAAHATDTPPPRWPGLHLSRCCCRL